MNPHVIGLFGLLALGTILFVIQMFTRKNILDAPMLLGAVTFWTIAGYGFVKLAFGTT